MKAILKLLISGAMLVLPPIFSLAVEYIKKAVQRKKEENLKEKNEKVLLKLRGGVQVKLTEIANKDLLDHAKHALIYSSADLPGKLSYRDAILELARRLNDK